MFGYCTVEAPRMHWLKRDKWKTGIAIAGMLLLLVLMVWVPVSAAGAYEGALGLATPVTGTVQATPTEDATVTALNKEKLAQEIQQLKNQNALDFFGWLRTNAAVLLSTLVVVIGGLIGLFRWLGDRRDEQEKRREDQRSEQEKRAEEQKRWLDDRQAEREKRDEEQQRWLKDQEAEREKRVEERFQAVIEGLSSEREEARVGAAITLRTFLRPGYEQFYTQCFDLAVAHLRLPRTPDPPEDPNIALPLTTLSQALSVVFKEVFPLARSQNQRGPQSLDAAGIQLDNAYLWMADLKQAWMPHSSLRKAELIKADLREADLYGADLRAANLRAAKLSQTQLEGADLRGAELRGERFGPANLEDALSLKGTDLRGVKGLTKEQLEYCKARGAIIDEDSTTSLPQAPVSPSPPSQSNDAQAPSVPSAQASTPLPETDGSSASSSQRGPGS